MQNVIDALESEWNLNDLSGIEGPCQEIRIIWMWLRRGSCHLAHDTTLPCNSVWFVGLHSSQWGLQEEKQVREGVYNNNLILKKKKKKKRQWTLVAEQHHIQIWQCIWYEALTHGLIEQSQTVLETINTIKRSYCPQDESCAVFSLAFFQMAQCPLGPSCTLWHYQTSLHVPIGPFLFLHYSPCLSH